MVENIILLESIIEFRVFEDLRLKVYFENNLFVGAGGKVVFWAKGGTSAPTGAFQCNFPPFSEIITDRPTGRT